MAKSLLNKSALLQKESGTHQIPAWWYCVMDKNLNIKRAWNFITVLYMQIYTLCVTHYRDPWVGEDILCGVSSPDVDLQHLSNQLLKQNTQQFRTRSKLNLLWFYIWNVSYFDHTSLLLTFSPCCNVNKWSYYAIALQNSVMQINHFLLMFFFSTWGALSEITREQRSMHYFKAALISQQKKIVKIYDVDIDHILANNWLFTHPAETEQHSYILSSTCVHLMNVATKFTPFNSFQDSKNSWNIPRNFWLFGCFVLHYV